MLCYLAGMLVGDDESATTKNVGKSLDISIAEQMRWYNAVSLPEGACPGLHSKQLDATIGQRACAISPRRPPWSTNKTLMFMRFSGPETDPLLSSLMRQASFKCETPRLKLKSSRRFLAIKLCQGTKSKKDIKRSRSSSKKLSHMMCAISVVNCWDIEKTLPFIFIVNFGCL